VGALGLVFSGIGLLGIYDNTPTYVRVFWYFMIAEIVVSIAIFGADMVQLQGCESWLTSSVQNQAYNPTLDRIAKEGACSMTRVAYGVIWCLLFLIRSYFAFVVWQFYRTISEGSNYLIHFDKEETPSVFVAPVDHPQYSNYGATQNQNQSQPARSLPVRSPPAYFGTGGAPPPGYASAPPPGHPTAF